MALRTKYRIIFYLLIALCLLPGAVEADMAMGNATGQQHPASLFLFRPTSDSIPSAQVNAIINGLHGEVLIGTPLGLTTYTGDWSTQHVDLNNDSNGLLDNFVTALAYDRSGNLWIGYAGGIQIYDGSSYQTIDDQEILKNLQIRALQRWNDDMWIATGNAGLSRYSNGTWTWYAPFSSMGPGFYQADSMALDSSDGILLVGTNAEGLWAVTPSNGTTSFVKIADKNDPYGLYGHISRDPLGGAYFFNATGVVHYDAINGFTQILSDNELDGGPWAINDAAGGSDGSLYVATDNGIYVWQNGAIRQHLGAFEGFGTSSHSVKRVFVDAGGRLWFSTMDIIGCYTGDVSSAPSIAVEMMTPTPLPIPTPVVPVNTTQTLAPASTATPQNPSVIDTIVGFFTGFLHPGGH
jgi:ligand-binding sensor domain-containing protein